MKKSMVMVLGAVALAGAAQAETYTWVKSDWHWSSYGFGGTLPGTDDTAVFNDGVENFKQNWLDKGARARVMFDGGTTEVGKLVLENLYGIQFYSGNAEFRVNAIDAADLYPGPDDSNRPSNLIEIGGTGITLKGDSSEIHVGANHELEIKSSLRKSAEGTTVVKTGAGTLISSGADWEPTGETWVKEGALIRTGGGSPSFKGSLTIGGAGHAASVVVRSGTNNNTMGADKDLNVLSGGSLVFEGKTAALNLQRITVDHGLIDYCGGSSYQPNSAAQEIRYSLNGGVITNAYICLWGGDLEIVPSTETSFLYGTLGFNAAKDVTVADGSAPVDFLISGDFAGGNRGVHKAGPGTMAVCVGDHVGMWGGTAGRPFQIKEGSFYFESLENEGVGMGTNNVEILAGSTYGAVGRHVGAEIPLRGRWGKVILNGEAGVATTFAIGRIDVATGCLKPGRYTVGAEEEPGAVEFKNEGVLKIAADKTGVSKLVVNGTFALSGNDTLDIVGPTNSYELEPGTYEIVKTSKAMNTTFKAITYNGGTLPKNLKVTSTDKLITLRVAPKGLAIVIR